MDKHHRILAVDDDPINISILEDLLEDYDLYTAVSGEEAIEMAIEKSPDLILLDIMMPGINGYEVCRRLRDNPKMRHVKIILVSAKAQVEERLAGYDAGANDYVVKPFDCMELLAKIKVYLRLKSMEEVDQLKTSMLNLLSHELRTPLTGMICGLEILADECPADAKERQKMARLVLDNVHRLQHLIEQVMKLSSLEAGEDAFDKQSVDLGEIVETALFNTSKIAAEKEVSMNTISHSSIDVCVDSEAIRKVIEIIVDNAIHYSPSQGAVEVSILEAQGMAVVEVSDHGQGIAKDQQSFLFTGFSDCDVMHHTKGTGLSLAIAHRIIQHHSGEITVDSDINEGACFRITLPLATQAQLQPDDAPTACQVS